MTLRRNRTVSITQASRLMKLRETSTVLSENHRKRITALGGPNAEFFKRRCKWRSYMDLPLTGHMPLFVKATALIIDPTQIDNVERDPHCNYDLYDTTYFCISKLLFLSIMHNRLFKISLMAIDWMP